MLTCAALRETSCWGGGGGEGDGGLRVDGEGRQEDGVVVSSAVVTGRCHGVDTAMSISSSSCDSVANVH